MVTVILLVLALLPGCIPVGVISVATEDLLTLSQLARRLPRRRQGRPVHAATVHRWRNPGVRGVRLDCIRVGGQWHTSMEAFQRFCEQLTPQGGGGGIRPTPPRRADAPQIDQALDQFGL